MLVTVGICKLSERRIRIEVQRPQHTAQADKSFASEKAARRVLSNFGISDGQIMDFFKLLPNLEENVVLNFPPLDVPQHTLVTEGFQLEID